MSALKTIRLKSGHAAFSLVELLVIIAVFVFLGALVLPALSNCKCKDASIECMNNLKQAGLAFRMWEGDNSAYPMLFQTNTFDGPSYAKQQKMYVYFQTMSNELNTPKILICPADNRAVATNFETLRNTNISYFVGLDADETMPQMLLAGDCNLTINGVPAGSGLAVIKANASIGWTTNRHRSRGNVALADGSVQQMRQLPGRPGTNVIRLAIP